MRPAAYVCERCRRDHCQKCGSRRPEAGTLADAFRVTAEVVSELNRALSAGQRLEPRSSP